MTAAKQRERRKKHQRLKRCLWCRRPAKKGLCKRCKRKNRIARRKQWAKKRRPGAKQYQCTVCHRFGHNARRHKQGDADS